MALSPHQLTTGGHDPEAITRAGGLSHPGLCSSLGKRELEQALASCRTDLDDRHAHRRGDEGEGAKTWT